MRLSLAAAFRCKDRIFQRFMQVQTEHEAADKLRRICMIKSRAELDNDQEAAQRYHRLIGLPFSEFINSHQEA